MRNYRELVYSILDELKIFSDDSVWETDQMVSLLNKYRALLFNQKYKGKKVEIPFAWYQRLGVSINYSTDEIGVYQSNAKIPNVLDIGNIWQYTFVKETILDT